MTARSLWCRVAVGSVAAAVTAVAAPFPAPAPERIGMAAGAASGALAGAALFVALARRRPVLRVRGALTTAQLCFLVGWAWVEETLWRGLLLAGLAAAAGAGLGLAATTLLFAAAHPQARATQAATGATFGLAYLGTGRLAAAFAAHAAYNLLVAGSCGRPGVRPG